MKAPENAYSIPRGLCCRPYWSEKEAQCTLAIVCNHEG
jgi:hypothetical protein